MLKEKSFIGMTRGTLSVISDPIKKDGYPIISVKCSLCGWTNELRLYDFVKSKGICKGCRGYMGMVYGNMKIVEIGQGNNTCTARCLDCNNEKKINVYTLIKNRPLCSICFPPPKKRQFSVGDSIGFQMVIGIDPYRRTVRCSECLHEKSVSLAELRRSRYKGACNECGAGLPSRYNFIGQRVGDYEIVSLLNTGHYKNKIVLVRCLKCNNEAEKNLSKFLRSAGTCPKCKRSNKTKRSKIYKDWKSAKRAFRKNNPEEKCGTCGLSTWMGYKLPMQIDHVIPASRGGLSTLDNMDYICGNCHIIKTALEHPTWEIERVE